MEKIQAQLKLPYLAVDGGNLLFKQEQLAPGLLQQAEITAAGIVDSYNHMGFAGVAVGKIDLAAGLGFLQEQAARSRFAWLSANLVRKSDEKPVFAASLVREVGNISVGLIGLTATDGSVLFTENENAAIIPWQKALPGLVKDLADRCDLIILLSNYAPQQNQEIAQTFADIHIIIQSAPRSRNVDPQLNNNTLVAQTAKQGKYLGWMLVNWQRSKAWGRAGATKDLATKKQELDGINGRISRIERREKKDDLPANTSYQNLLATKDQLHSEIIFLENEIAGLKESGQTPATYENSFVALDANLPDQPDVKMIVDDTKKKINLAGRSQAAESAAGAADRPKLQIEDLVFTGWQTCAGCHQPQTEFWKTTDHSTAYQSLAEQEQQFNLDCLPCHVTAEYKETRISNDASVLLSLPGVLQQVGCEVCHGPGKEHGASQAPTAISRKPAESICLRCHTPERDEEFNYRNDVIRIGCPAG